MPGTQVCVRSPAVESHTVFLVVVLGVFGLAIGSFANVVIYRVPRGESVAHPPSRCPTCGTQLSAAENVPLFSWLALRGRCRHCHTPISPRYPLVEGATAAVFALTAGFVGATWQLVPLLMLGAAIVVVVGIDVDGFVTPFPILVVLGLAVVVTAAMSLADGDDRATITALLAGAASACVGALAATSPSSGSSGPLHSARVARLVVAGSLGWFAGWASVTAGAVVVGVFVVTTAVAVVGGRTGDEGPDAASRPGALRERVPLWLPAVLSYGVVLGAAAAR